MEKRKIIGTITSKEYQKLSDNFKFRIITSDKQKFFFYSQQRHREVIGEITVGEKYSFTLYDSKKYWFLESWEKAKEISQKNPEWLSKWKAELSNFNLKALQEQAQIKEFQKLENRLSNLIKQISETSSEEEIFLEYLEQFINLLLIKQLSISDNSQLTEKEKRERKILDKIVANWFYKT